MKKSVLFGVFFSIALFLTTSLAQAQVANSKLVIRNTSMWNIEYIYISLTTDEYWGDDLLGDYDILETGEQISISLSCNNYDVKLIDEDSDECIVYDVYLCDDVWVIDDDTLLDCIYGD